ncbi:helix-turn-helix domain-containing protein [Halorussus halophilus]|uniref:helix-turn-helix domain-containing protein n=1 Tax=Halorussus halophilus TaxID=2650975 RepID=UPI001CE4A0BC|nr:helix-turn-helix domain-containing protein [Halorussus halophilus]
MRSIELDNAFYVEDGTWIESLTISSNESFDISATVEQISGVSLYYRHEIPTGPTEAAIERVTVLANESFPFILGVVLRQEAIPNRIVLRDNQFSVVTTVRDWEQFRELADEVQQKLGQFDLQKVNNIERPGEPLDGGRLSEILITKLTEVQIETIETAYDLGYFEVPRESSATEVAEALEISQSTLSERLRTAQLRLFELIFGSNTNSI